MNNRTDFYCSWLPFGSGQTVRDTEIGINALVAEAIGNVAKNKSNSIYDKGIFFYISI